MIPYNVHQTSVRQTGIAAPGVALLMSSEYNFNRVFVLTISAAYRAQKTYEPEKDRVLGSIKI